MLFDRKCCPPGRGCNIGPSLMQPCHRGCAKSMSDDSEFVEAMEYWWDKFNATAFYKLRERKEAHRNFEYFRDHALESKKDPAQLFKKQTHLTRLI